MKRILVHILALISLAGVLQLAALSLPASAQFDAATGEACEGLTVDNRTPSGSGFIECDTGGSSTVSDILATTLNIISIVAGVIAVIMIVISGIRFMTSQGEASGVASARSTLIYALVGVVIVLLAQSIVFFVINRATDVPLSDNPNNTDDTITECTPVQADRGLCTP